MTADRATFRTDPGRLLGKLSLLSVASLAAAACFRKIWAADFWWQYKTGEYVAEHGWPSVDVFTYTAEGRPWIELHWLFCLIQYHVMERLGAAGIESLKAATVILAFALVALPFCRRQALVAPALTLSLSILAASQRFYVRPELATFVLFAAFVLILDHHRKEGGRWIWLLPALQVVWVNTHPLFLLGPILVGLLLTVVAVRYLYRRDAHDRRQVVRLGAVLIVTLAACLINPYGIHGAVFPLQLFAKIRGTIFKNAIGELRSPFSFDVAYTAVTYYKALIVLALLSAVINLRRLDPFWTVLCLSQFYLSALAIRNLPLFCLAAVPFILCNIERSPVWGLATVRRRLPVGRALVASGVVVLCAWYSLEFYTDRFNVRQNDSNQFGVGVAEHRYPTGAVEFLERHGLEGNVFGGLFENGYLLSRDRQVFFDPRLEIHDEAMFGRFLRIQRDGAALREAAGEYGIRVIVAGLQSKLAGLAWRQPDWLLVYFDSVAAVFVHADKAGGLETLDEDVAFERAVDRIRDELLDPVSFRAAGAFKRVTSAVPYVALADFLMICGQADRAEEFLRDAETASPFVTGLPLRWATLSELRGDWHQAAERARAGLEDSPRDPMLQFKLGNAHYALNEPAEARLWLERSLERLPGRAETWGLLGSIHAQEASLQDAQRCLEQAVALAPGAPIYIANLARVRGRLGERAEAIAGLKEALSLAPRDVSVLRDLALLEAAEGNVKTARHYLERALQLSPTDPKLNHLHQQLTGN